MNKLELIQTGAGAKIIMLGAVSWLLLSGFSLSPGLVPAEDIISGGPGKDGIPALTDPVIEAGKSANRWMEERDRVIGVVINDQARAYPIRILNWHEIVNDQIKGKRFVVTYCPLCGSGMVFDSKDNFGVSGLLYQSDVLLYDKKTESLWSQLESKAITGKRLGEKLKTLPVLHTTWKYWFKKHPDTSVLSRQTGYSRDYNRDPYAGYESDKSIYFPVQHHDNRLHLKTWVIGLEMNGKTRAWPLDGLKKTGGVHETWQGRNLHIRYQSAGNHAEITDKGSGRVLETITLYWFAWATFHPETGLYTKSK
ncbi:MAG: DUF3179 domain-containing protein [Mariprofundaceae bacterium]